MQLINGAVSLALLLVLLPCSAAQTDGSGGGAVSPPPIFNLGEELNPTMAIVMVVLVSAFFSLGFFSVYIRQCAQRRIRGGGGGAAASRRSWRAAFGAGDDVIRGLPSFVYSAEKGIEIGNGKGSSLECAVCLNEFEDDETLRLLPKCGHVFHSDCVDAWLSTHTTCPVCRSNLVPKPGEDRNFTAVRVVEPVIGSGERENSEPVLQSPEARPRSPGGIDLLEIRIGGMLPRSNSTGHSLVRFGEGRDRIPPEDVRIQILNSTLRRSRSLGD